jgi:hypothetical protein
MSNNYWDDEDEDETTITGNESENDLQKKLRKKIKADEKRMKELEEKLDGYVKKEKESSVKELLEKQGVNPKAARLILKDLEEVNEETVQNWLDDNGDLFGYNPAEGAREVDGNRAELRKQNAVTQGAITPDRGEDMEMKIDGAQSAEELTRILYSQS